MPLVRVLRQSLVEKLKELARDEPEDSREVVELREKLASVTQRSLKYHEVIEKLIAQRDQWKHLYFLHARTHINAQDLLQRNLIRRDQQLRNAIAMLNAARKKLDEPPVKTPADLLDAAPVVLTAEDYARRMSEARRLISPDIDGLAEREKISSRTIS